MDKADTLTIHCAVTPADCAIFELDGAPRWATTLSVAVSGHEQICLNRTDALALREWLDRNIPLLKHDVDPGMTRDEGGE